VPLLEVVAAATSRPAAILGLEDVGTLRPGAPADVAVLRLEYRASSLADSDGVTETVTSLVRPVLTIVGGEVHRVDEVDVPLRPILDADREVDCAVPI
jgi:dihydroorotase